MTKMLAFFLRFASKATHNDSLRAGIDAPRSTAVSPYIAAMLPRVE